MTQKTWRVGVAGLGTVGGGLLQFLSARPDFAPAGDLAEVVAVSARSKSRPRTVDISGLEWFDDPVALASSPNVDLFVELVGGSGNGRTLRQNRQNFGRRHFGLGGNGLHDAIGLFGKG